MTEKKSQSGNGYYPGGRGGNSPEFHDGANIDALNGAKILLVEDNIINQEVASSILAQKNVVTVVAENGRQALEKLSSENFDCVLMDIQMPVMDGYEAARTIRQDKQYKNLPILAMTANTLSSDSQCIREAGMNGHIAKPIDRDMLFRELARWIGRDLQADSSTGCLCASPVKSPENTMIDMEASLKRVGGNHDLHRRILKTFVQKHGQDHTQVAEYIHSGDIDSAQNITHSLKGVAKIVGSEVLYTVVSDLDTLLNDGNEEQYHSCIDVFSDVLGDVVLTIEAYIQDTEQEEA